ncbi:MAG: hypothetical protein RMJ59_07295 [Candidatus Nitrosocaldus sp.]|nr:hypothetical protein [Candidatus Nitrosocaldus sp.]MCS7141704.1 hypothetical protein [Candidatus Nitrosocaldus sp.]MDW8000723.1 hypothetical protein [Candidatus Nitrosocaldus sp.]MDW8276164.1 hypothetical protein [Candidatus Nitrosocaldus sp.]
MSERQRGAYMAPSPIALVFDTSISILLLQARILLLLNKMMGSWLSKYVEFLESEAGTPVRERVRVE